MGPRQFLCLVAWAGPPYAVLVTFEEETAIGRKTAAAHEPRLGVGSVAAALLPLMAVVAVAYLVTGVAMPVLPVYVHQGLGFGTFVVGLIAGTQFAATLISRLWAGRYADVHGSKRAVLAGLSFAGAAGAAYLASAHVATHPIASVTILLVGRALLGVMESFVITGALTWGVTLAGPQNTGKVMSWVGTALYTAFAVGAPLGTGLYASYGFGAIALATMLLPLATVGVVAPLRPIAPPPHVRPAFRDVVRAIWVPGVALALSGVGFAAITTFVPLLFAERGWGQAWIALTAFSAAFMVARVAFGHLPDRIGGVKVALFCMVIEAAGLAVIWLASGFTAGMVGVMLTGLGYSLVYPSLGVEAVRLAPPESRGVAMGTYTAFLDLGLGVASPTLGLLAAAGDLSLVFLISAGVVTTTAAFGAVAIPSRSSRQLTAESPMRATPTGVRA
jgi:MFS family permease